MKSRKARLAPALALLALGALPALADTLVLRNGRSLTGEIVSFQNGRLEFRIDRGTVEKFPLGEVERIEFSGRDALGNRDDRAPRPPGNERPSGLREREVDVAGASAWTKTTIEVRDGQELWFDSKGEVRWGPGRKDGPGGESGSPRNQARPLPTRPAASLIGKVGETGDPFFIGTERGPLRVRGRGTLFLGVNDDYLQDNSGSFRVLVYY
jgi:hypothetical protein